MEDKILIAIYIIICIVIFMTIATNFYGHGYPIVGANIGEGLFILSLFLLICISLGIGTIYSIAGNKFMEGVIANLKVGFPLVIGFGIFTLSIDKIERVFLN